MQEEFEIWALVCCGQLHLKEGRLTNEDVATVVNSGRQGKKKGKNVQIRKPLKIGHRDLKTADHLL